MPFKDPMLRPLKTTQQHAKILAMVVRNAMEDFHCEHLSQAQMAELNPIIRNAIYTGLQAMWYYKKSEKARYFVDYHLQAVPDYWEPPTLLPCVEEVLREGYDD